MTKIAILGGAGFIGCNTAFHYLQKGCKVYCFDNLSRSGVENNLKWLESLDNKDFSFTLGSVTSFNEVESFIRKTNPDIIFNFAAQVAVTTSVADPRQDFECNLLGSFNVLEAIRLSGKKPVTLFTSTNKVYGGMETAKVILDKNRYCYADFPEGISEEWPLDFHSPYGCSKGGADQYFRDYSRIYDLPITVFRMSCIYGIHQFGNEDQGWVAHFARCALTDIPIQIYGDGMQVRDILFINDLVNAFDIATSNPQKSNRKIFNIGGGSKNTISLLELIDMLKSLVNHEISFAFNDWRPGDQKIYISDISKACKLLGWYPKINKKQGIELLFNWMKDNINLFEK
ncbi:MAG: GDP-mannose 4,6-dehydratase [Candidatus Coatesbacteria bacterium]|nr:GDP-mannose 4,6-dehydratase [Candidatus Coatesbacteria bacterium]